MFACPRLGEEGVETVVAPSDGLVRGHLAVRLDPVLQAVQLPAGIADLAAGLADVDRDALALSVQNRSFSLKTEPVLSPDSQKNLYYLSRFKGGLELAGSKANRRKTLITAADWPSQPCRLGAI